MLGDLLDLLGACLGLTVDVAKKVTKKTLLGYAKLLLLGGGVALVILGLALMFFLAGWINAAALVAVVTPMAVWLLILAMPLELVLELAASLLPEAARSAIRRNFLLMGFVILWGIFLSLYFYLVPTPRAAVPIVFVVCGGIALASWLASMGVGTKLISLRLFILLTVLTGSFVFGANFPRSKGSPRKVATWLDKQISGKIDNLTDPMPGLQEVEYGPGLIKFDQRTGEGLYCYAERQDGLHLYPRFGDSCGYDAATGEPMYVLDKAADKRFAEQYVQRQQQVLLLEPVPKEPQETVEEAVVDTTTSTTTTLATVDVASEIVGGVESNYGDGEIEPVVPEIVETTPVNEPENSGVGGPIISPEFDKKFAEEAERVALELEVAKKATPDIPPMSEPINLVIRAPYGWWAFSGAGDKFEGIVDRPLEISGRVVVKPKKKVRGDVIDSDRNYFVLQIRPIKGEGGRMIEFEPLRIQKRFPSSRAVTTRQLSFKVK